MPKSSSESCASGVPSPAGRDGAPASARPTAAPSLPTRFAAMTKPKMMQISTISETEKLNTPTPVYHDCRVVLDVVVGLGANLGDRAETLLSAVRAMAALPGTEVVAVSAFRETAPVGGPPQGEFVNAAARVSTAMSPRALLEALLSIERAHGRERRERWGPRTLDLDILWIRGLAVEEAGLEVPHPRLSERDFALGPLLELVPDATDPRSGARLSDALGALQRSGEP